MKESVELVGFASAGGRKLVAVDLDSLVPSVVNGATATNANIVR